MSRTVFWSSARSSFDDGFYRRRVAIPAAGLRPLGWRMLSGGETPDPTGVVVLDGLGRDDLALAEAASAVGTRVVLDASRWACAGLNETGAETLRFIAGIADRVIAPTEPLAEAVGLALGCIGKVAVVPDPVETPTALQLAAMIEGAAYSPAPLAGGAEPRAVWFATPDDGPLDAELGRLADLTPQLAAAGLKLLALAPPEALGRIREQLGGAVETAAWTLETGPAELSRAAVCVLPGAVGSAGWSVVRRAALAEALGVPVLAPSGPEWSAAPFRPVADDWSHGIERAVSGELAIAAAAKPAPPPVTAGDVALAWDRLLSDLVAGQSHPAPPVRLLILLDLIQDGELCLPLAREAMSRPDIELNLAVTSWFARNAPGAMKALGGLGRPVQVVEREQLLAKDALKDGEHDAVLVAVATNLRAHRHTQAAVEAVAASGGVSFSMQHGLENVGLTFFDELHTDDVEITSDHVFVWFPPDFAPPSPLSLRRKFIHVGAVKSARASGPPPPLPNDQRPLVSVFENLHWHRYDHDFRQQFIADLLGAARAAPTTRFVLKPHPAGMWTKGQALPQLPDNLMVIDPTDSTWGSVSAQALIARSDRVITTPSTVALDAALAHRPVAIVGYDLDLPVYTPLPILRHARDWAAFAGPQGRAMAGDIALNTFLRRSLVRDEAAPHLLDALVDRVRRLR